MVNANGYYLVSNEVWHYDGNVISRVIGREERFPIEPGKSLLDWYKHYHRDMIAMGEFLGDVVKSEFEPGEYYSRIARPVFGSANIYSRSKEFEYEIISTQGILRSLIDLLDRILLVVYPSTENMTAYGYEIRNLLMLACMECEAQWRSVLQANGYIKKRYSTTDYIRIERPMRLRDYAVGFVRYPWLKPVRPFENWSKQEKPSQCLVWYEAYNATKHDRIGNLGESTLKNAMTALAACWVMQVSQFGNPVIGDHQIIGDYFRIDEAPRWTPSEQYIFDVDLPYQKDWHAIECPDLQKPASPLKKPQIP